MNNTTVSTNDMLVSTNTIIPMSVADNCVGERHSYIN